MGTRIYDKWRQGVSGVESKGEYNAKNAQVYEDGTLGVRPGWRTISQTLGTAVWNANADDFQGLTWYQQTDGDQGLVMWFYDASASAHKYDVFSLENNTWSAGGSVNSVSGSGALFHPNDYDDNAKFLCWNDGFLLTAMGPYLAIATASTPGTFTVPTIAAGQPRSVVIYRERAYYFGISAHPGRIYYSDAADYATVQSTSFFEVNVEESSYAGAVTGMWAVKNALVIARKDDRWLVLTGTAPENGSLRELGRDQVPDFGAAAVSDNELYFLDRTGKGVWVATPSFVDGQALAHVAPTAYAGSLFTRPENDWFPQLGVGDEITRSLFLPGKQSGNSGVIIAAERVNDVWGFSLWTHDDATVEDLLFTSGAPGHMYAVVHSGSSVILYSRDYTLNRPANSADAKSKALGSEDGTASPSGAVVDLGEINAGEGMRVRPTKVVLDLRYWKGGNYSDPEVTVTGFIFGTDADTPHDTLASVSADVSGWADSVGNLPYRKRVALALPQGQFGTTAVVRLAFDNLALESVQVYYDEERDTR